MTSDSQAAPRSAEAPPPHGGSVTRTTVPWSGHPDPGIAVELAAVLGHWVLEHLVHRASVLSRWPA